MNGFFDHGLDFYAQPALSPIWVTFLTFSLPCHSI